MASLTVNGQLGWHTEPGRRKRAGFCRPFDQFQTEIDGLDIHFIHQRSPHPEAVPLVIVTMILTFFVAKQTMLVEEGGKR